MSDIKYKTTNPTWKEMVASRLERMGLAPKYSQTIMGGDQSVIPGGFGAIDALNFAPGPVGLAANAVGIADAVRRGEYENTAGNALLMMPKKYSVPALAGAAAFDLNAQEAPDERYEFQRSGAYADPRTGDIMRKQAAIDRWRPSAMGQRQDYLTDPRSTMYDPYKQQGYADGRAVKNAGTKMARDIATRLLKDPMALNEARFRALSSKQPVYTNIESATVPMARGDERLIGRGATSRAYYPGNPGAHEAAIRGTLAERGAPSLGSWEENGLKYTNPGSSVNLGARPGMEFPGYGGSVTPEVEQAASELRQTGAGVSRFTPFYTNNANFLGPRAEGGTNLAAEYRVDPTPNQMRAAMNQMTNPHWNTFMQHVPQEGVVRMFAADPTEARTIGKVFGTQPRFGVGEANYNEAYPIASELRKGQPFHEVPRDPADLYAGHLPGSGVQVHSAGDHYPFIVSQTGDLHTVSGPGMESKHFVDPQDAYDEANRLSWVLKTYGNK